MPVQHGLKCPPIRGQYLDWSGPMRALHSASVLPLMTRAAPARAPILRPGVKGAGWGAGRGRGAERIWRGASRRRRRNTCRADIILRQQSCLIGLSTHEVGSTFDIFCPTWSFLSYLTLPHVSGYCGVVWCVLWSWYLTSPHRTISSTPPTRLFILQGRADQHKLRLFLLNCYQPPLRAALENIHMKTFIYLIFIYYLSGIF